MPTTNGATAAAAGTVEIGGDITVNRLGFGAMRITGRGIWGDPPDRTEARNVLRRAVELGVNFIDTADSYGPKVSEELIAEALYIRIRTISSLPPKADFCDPARGGGIPTAGPSTCARPVKAACDACGWTRSRCTSSTGPTRRCRSKTRSAPLLL